MSFWRLPTVEHDVAPIFRLLEEFDNVRRVPRASSIRAFQPRFDVAETKEAYELHGELPGIDQKDIEITFSDPHTIKISGHTERTFTKGTPPAGLVEGGDGKQGQISDDYESIPSKQPSVEDEAPETPSTAADKKQVEMAGQAVVKDQQKQDGPKYWVSERAVGEFHRSFNFPSRVDPDRVKASMKSGILSIVVPKLAEQQSRRIPIE